MRYAKWKLNWHPDNRYGTGPENEIDNAEGAFFIGPNAHDFIVGYVYSDHSLEGLDKWSVEEITDDQALYLAKQIDSKATIDDQGKIIFTNFI